MNMKIALKNKLKNTGERPAADALFSVLCCPLLANFGNVKQESFVLPIVFAENRKPGKKHHNSVWKHIYASAADNNE